MNKVKLIAKEELELINGEVGRLFGTNNQIVSGSCEETEYGKRYNIVLDSPTSYRPQAMLENMGRVVKNLLEVEPTLKTEVFYYGMKLA